MVEELAQADDAVAACVDDAAWALAEDEMVAALDAAHRLEQRLAAVTLALVREIDGRGTARAQGASSTAVWLRERLRLTVPAARRLVDLAAALRGPRRAARPGRPAPMPGARPGLTPTRPSQGDPPEPGRPGTRRADEDAGADAA
ncbi:DUF222 domain-containing protein [Micromonospora zamorensis]|uniref:DUF222 domain-containing protein n=1 Tax=Micromonospora zamorensis TaxID=709883 RepID=UPI003D8D9D1B